MKYIVIVPDGMCDNPIEELKGQTPLEAANTVNMDYLAKNGKIGKVRTIPEGMVPGSDVGNLSLLGYDPASSGLGRAPLEAANLNIELAPDEVAFRCNFVTIEDNKMIDYSAGHISTAETELLIKSLNSEMDLDDVQFYVGKSYRNLMIIKVRNPRGYLDIKTTPPHDIMDQAIENYLPKGAEEGLILKYMEKSKNILSDHEVNKVRVDLKENPANMIWLWGQGIKPKLVPFEDKFGIKGSIISAVDLVNGIGKLAGLNVVKVPGITGYYDTNYLGKAQYALDSLKNSDFVFIHIEAPDEASHNGEMDEKIKAIEMIDKEIVGTVLNHFNKNDDVRILVVPDHYTPLDCRTHTSDPVCFVMYGKNIPKDYFKKYSETTAGESELLFESGEELLDYFIKKYL